MLGQSDLSESFSGFPHFFQSFHLKQKKCYPVSVPVLLKRQETKVGLHDCKLKTCSLYREMIVRDYEIYSAVKSADHGRKEKSNTCLIALSKPFFKDKWARNTKHLLHKL